MTDIEKVQKIGQVVCEECGPDSGCGVEPEKCNRIRQAVTVLNNSTTQDGDYPRPDADGAL